MHRPAKMDQPENIIDLPLSKMGQDEILPTPVTGAFTEEEHLQLASGTFDTKKGWNGKATLWVNLDIPVLGVVKAEMEEWAMELFQISDLSEDLLPQKPPQGGIVYLNK